MEANEIKGIFEGDNASANIEAVKGILKEKGYDVLNEDSKKALFSENTKKAVSSVHEDLGKRGLEILKNEQGEEVKYSQQAFQHIDRMTATITNLENKIANQEKAQKSEDPDKLKIANQELNETRKLLKDEQEKYAKQASEFESKYKEQQQTEAIRGGLEGLKYKDGVKPEDVESAQAFAISQVKGMPTQDRNGVNVFLSADGDALRDPQGNYKTAKDILKEKLSFILDTHTPPAGTGTGETKYESNSNNNSSTYIYQGETTKSQLCINMKKFSAAKGVEWSNLQPLYRELAATHKLQ